MPTPKPRIADLGNLSGDVLVFGGPYSNLQATKALFATAHAREIPASNIICTGDAVAYCADPRDTLHVVAAGCVHLAGNCEVQLAAGAPDCGCGFEEGTACDVLSKGWYPYAQAAMDSADRDHLAELPDLIVFTNRGRRYGVLHGGVDDISRYIWPTDPDHVFTEEIARFAELTGHLDTILAGHCGVAFQRQIGDVAWINAGVIGVPPHDGRRDTRYVVLGEQGAIIERLSYDAEAAARAMEVAGMTQGYETALRTGIWPSQDVLPEQMRR